MTEPAQVKKIDGPRVEPLAGGAPTSMVVFLHGYGSNGADLIGLAPYWRQALPGTVFLSPNAPEPCPGAPGGYQWWGLSSMDRNARAAGAARAAPVLDAFLDAELARYGLAKDRVALVGFSQGTMMALEVGPRRKPAVAAIIGYSGMLADEAGLVGGAGTRPPILLVHGDADPMIPVAAFYQAREALIRLGFSVESHVSHGLAHSIDAAGLQLGGALLVRVFG
jgi:phospholipase/carboxylesterase